jgi:maleate isomerase
MYGWRGRIGLLVPTGNAVMEPEFQQMAPEGIVTLANRVELKDVTPASLRAMEGDVARAARQIAQSRVGVIAFGCTSGSFVDGPGHDERLVRLIEAETGIPATTTTTAVVRALTAVGVRRIALATPYTDEVTRLEVAFLEASGFEVTAWQGGGIVETADIQVCPPEASYRRARAVDSDRAEAVFISCTGFRTIENISKLESDLGKPVVTSNQATFADCLHLLGVGDARSGFGSLFGRLHDWQRTCAETKAAIAST